MEEVWGLLPSAAHIYASVNQPCGECAQYGPRYGYPAVTPPALALPPEIGMGSLGSLPVTMLIMAIGMSLGGTTGYAINPARDLPPRVAHSILPIRGKGTSGWGYSWVPVAGPVLGALAAVAIYGCIYICS